MNSLKPSTLQGDGDTPNGHANGHANGSGRKHDSKAYQHMDSQRRRHKQREAKRLEKEKAEAAAKREARRARVKAERARMHQHTRHPRAVEQTTDHPANDALSVMKPRNGPTRTRRLGVRS